MKQLDIKLPEELSKLLQAVREQEQVRGIISHLVKDKEIMEASSCVKLTPLSKQECEKYGITQGSNVSLMLGMFREKIKDKSSKRVTITDKDIDLGTSYEDFVPTTWNEFFSEDNKCKKNSTTSWTNTGNK
jgi:hypothetical protein